MNIFKNHGGITRPNYFGLGATLVVLLLLCQVAACVAGSAPSLSGQVDLRAFYAAGKILRSGHASNLYDYGYQQKVQNTFISPRAGALPFLYPPFAGLLFIPLSLLSYRAAFFAMLALNLCLLFSAARLLSPWLSIASRARNSFLLVALYGSLFSVSVALMQGQISFLLLLVFCGGYVLRRHGREYLAGLVLSLGLAKFQLILPVVLLFVLWKQWRLIAGFFAGALILCLISFLIVGRGGVASYGHNLFGMVSYTALNAAAGKVRYGMFPTDMPNLHGLSFGVSHGASWGQLLNIVLCCLTLAWASRQKPSLLVALPAAMLVSYHMQPHDLILILLPLSFAVEELFLRTTHAENHGHGRRISLRKIAILVAMLLLTLPMAGWLMARGMGYMVSAAVALVMIVVAQHDSLEQLPLPVLFVEELQQSNR